MLLGQSFPVASTGMSSYFSKLIPVLCPAKSSLKDKWKNIPVSSSVAQDKPRFCV